MATLFAEPATIAEPAIATHTIDRRKVYGRSQTEVRTLDGITVAFTAKRFTAIMGAVRPGKSTLLHSIAELDSLTSGQAFIGSNDLSRLDDRHLTRLRRDRVGFVFQAYNRMPTDALEDITLPLRLAELARLLRHVGNGGCVRSELRQ
jgi:putative ABC transport system ATP-binding protein